jgi:hypothetical protein
MSQAVADALEERGAVEIQDLTWASMASHR